MTAPLIVDCLLEAVSRERIQFYAKQYNLPEEDVEEISSYDPSHGKYLNWILRMVQGKELEFPEDGTKVYDSLSMFRNLSRKPAFKSEKDLNKYLSFDELTEVIAANSEVKTKGEIKRSAEMEGCKFLKQEGDEVVYLVTTPQAAAKLFRHTEWCIKDPAHFKDYYPKEFYYVEKNGKPYMLCHLGDFQMTNRNNEEELYPVPILEPYIATSASASYVYAGHVINAQREAKIRWLPGEPAISKDPYYAFEYARYFIGGKWPEGEEAISQEPGFSVEYAKFLGERFPAGEPAVLGSPWSSFDYAREVIKGPWPDGEKSIRKNPDANRVYTEFCASKDPLYPTLKKLKTFIRSAFNKDAVRRAIRLENGKRVSPFNEGCFIVAQALASVFPRSEFCSICSATNPGVDLSGTVIHYGIMTSNGIFADGGGAYETIHYWQAAFAPYNEFLGRSYSTLGLGPAGSNDSFPENPEASAELAEILKKLWVSQAGMASNA